MENGPRRKLYRVGVLGCMGYMRFKDVTNTSTDAIKEPDTWAVCLSEDGRYLAGTTNNGHIKVWDLSNGEQFRDYETKGAFGACIDMVRSA